MDKQMFLDNIFDYTSGSTDWKYKGEKPAVIDFYATWCGPCRMVAPLLKSLAKEYKDQIVVYKVDTDKQKRIICCHGDTVTAHHHLYPQNGTAANHYRSGQ